MLDNLNIDDPHNVDTKVGVGPMCSSTWHPEELTYHARASVAVPATRSEILTQNITDHRSRNPRPSEVVSTTTAIIILIILGSMILPMIFVPVVQRHWAKNAINTLLRVMVHERA